MLVSKRVVQDGAVHVNEPALTEVSWVRDRGEDDDVVCAACEDGSYCDSGCDLKVPVRILLPRVQSDLANSGVPET